MSTRCKRPHRHHARDQVVHNRGRSFRCTLSTIAFRSSRLEQLASVSPDDFAQVRDDDVQRIDHREACRFGRGCVRRR